MIVDTGLMYKTVQLKRAGVFFLVLWGFFSQNYHYQEGNDPDLKVSLQVTQTKPPQEAEESLGSDGGEDSEWQAQC